MGTIFTDSEPRRHLHIEELSNIELTFLYGQALIKDDTNAVLFFKLKEDINKYSLESKPYGINFKEESLSANHILQVGEELRVSPLDAEDILLYLLISKKRRGSAQIDSLIGEVEKGFSGLEGIKNKAITRCDGQIITLKYAMSQASIEAKQQFAFNYPIDVSLSSIYINVSKLREAFEERINYFCELIIDEAFQRAEYGAPFDSNERLKHSQTYKKFCKYIKPNGERDSHITIANALAEYICLYGEIPHSHKISKDNFWELIVKEAKKQGAKFISPENISFPEKFVSRESFYNDDYKKTYLLRVVVFLVLTSIS